MARAKDGSVSPVLRLLYRLYEARLRRQVGAKPMPRHLGIILDGNRRHGRAHGTPSRRRCIASARRSWTRSSTGAPSFDSDGHALGLLARQFPPSPAGGLGHPRRHRGQAAALAHDPLIHSRRVRVRAIGRLPLPESLVATITEAERATEAYDGMDLNIAVAYGGRQEIADAVQHLLRDRASRGESLTEAIAAVTPDAIAGHLYTAGLPDPDLIIRTSGEIRLSGFLLWQSAHSEYYFTDVLWPAFRKLDFLRALRTFQERQRRFGA